MGEQLSTRRGPWEGLFGYLTPTIDTNGLTREFAFRETTL